MFPKETNKILIVEDDKHIAEGLKLNLELQGFAVNIISDGATALKKWASLNPDLIILDIMLPNVDGLTILKNIRINDEKIPVLILSAKNSSKDKIKGLKEGVDDYLTKPFELEELLLRVENLIKRLRWNNKDEGKEIYKFEFGENKINFEEAIYISKKNNKEIRSKLTKQEIKLLKLLIKNEDKVLSRKELLTLGWEYTPKTQTRTLDNFISRFRKYFEDDPKKPKFFKSHRTIGYYFTRKKDYK